METWLGKLLVGFGLFSVVLGLILWFAPKVPWLGRLPGDFRIQGERFSFFFPLATCLILSILLTILLNLFLRR
jgi:ribose/xylose/arabinose/galactoside ABC-type transport system permease subunit